MTDDVKELVARLQSDVQTADCDCERCELFRAAAIQIEQDGKRIAELQDGSNFLTDEMFRLGQVIDGLKEQLTAADSRALAAAEAMREKAASKTGIQSIVARIEAIDASEVVKGLKP